MPIVHTAARRLYRCDNCSKTSAWEDGWAWYGSYRDLDDGESVLCMCSPECRIAMVAAGRMPADGLDDSGDPMPEDQKPKRRRRAVLGEVRGAE